MRAAVELQGQGLLRGRKQSPKALPGPSYGIKYEFLHNWREKKNKRMSCTPMGETPVFPLSWLMCSPAGAPVGKEILEPLSSKPLGGLRGRNPNGLGVCSEAH